MDLSLVFGGLGFSFWLPALQKFSQLSVAELDLFPDWHGNQFPLGETKESAGLAYRHNVD